MEKTKKIELGFFKEEYGKTNSLNDRSVTKNISAV